MRLGATTIWERWNSLDEMGHITGIDMNSLNHYAYGAIGEWLFAYAAGLRFCVHEPGFRRATVAPLTNWRLHMLDCVYRATTGRWRVVWECLDESHLHFLLTVPFGCTADVALPSAVLGTIPYSSPTGTNKPLPSWTRVSKTESVIVRVPYVN